MFLYGTGSAKSSGLAQARQAKLLKNQQPEIRGEVYFFFVLARLTGRPLLVWRTASRRAGLPLGA